MKRCRSSGKCLIFIAMVLAATAVGCTSSTTPPVQGNICMEFADFSCKWMLSCCEFDEIANLVGYNPADPETFEVIEALRSDTKKCLDVVHKTCENTFQMYLLALQSGRMTLNTTVWDSCKTAFNDGVSNCSSLSTSYMYSQTCKLDKILIGNQPPEGLCYLDDECTSGNWCLGGPPGFCAPRITDTTGICWDKAKCDIDKHCQPSTPAANVCVLVPVQSQDGFCSVDSDCADGLFCNEDTNKCTSKADTGGKCAKDHHCKSNRCDKNAKTCAALADSGQACNTSPECKSNLWCSPVPMVGVCTSPDIVANLGETCDGVLIVCKQGLRCLGSKCSAPVPDGNTCTSSAQCGDNSYCNAAGKCTSPRKAVDQACTSSSECTADLYCDGGTDQCKARIKQGEACTPGTCEQGLWCSIVTLLCESQYGGGQKCFEAEQCGKGLLCRGFNGLCSGRSGTDVVCNVDDECNGDLFCNPGSLTDVCADKRTAQVNESCSGSAVVCASDLYCSIIGNVCAGRKDVGANCFNSTECKSDLVCGVDDKCRQPAQLNDPCPSSPVICASDLYCTGGACAERQNEGATCFSNIQCKSSLYCDNTGSKCAARKDADAACTSDPECNDGLRCDSKSKTCVSLLGKGGVCTSTTDCQKTMYCKETLGKCAGRIATGAECPVLSSCVKGDACVTKATCADRLDVGSRCEVDLDCKKELVCSPEWLECVEPTKGIATGEHCNSDYECESGICQDHMCVAVCMGHLHL